MNIMGAIKGEAADSNLARTENGALGFANHKSDIVDFFYKVSTMRGWSAADKRIAFRKCLAEDRDLALRMLFFVRDVRGGMGERQLFRDLFADLDAAAICAFLPLVAEYGRWDDVIGLINADVSADVKKAVSKLLWDRLQEDLDLMGDGKSCSLLAKWLPSIRNVSRDSVKLAKQISSDWGWDERTYRKTLSKLRAYLKVVEKKMTAGEWTDIEYGAVPSKAAKNYREAFNRHDAERYGKYLEGLKGGTEKVNAATLYPHEIVCSYRFSKHSEDTLLESQWKALPMPKKGILGNAIVVRDGSGSMSCQIPGGTRTCALDVATALAILMSENLKGDFKDKFITFGHNPKFVDLGGCKNLHDKLQVAYREADCSNTNIEATMDLILRAAVKNEIPQEEIPAVVIISDMEFDEARGAVRCYWGSDHDTRSQDTLFAVIRKKWNDAGYDLPKMVFWNVNSRTGAVPMQESANGLLLVSGFSQSIMDMLSEGGTMIDIIRKKLMTPRYDAVSKAIAAAAE